MILTLDEQSSLLHFVKEVECKRSVRKARVRCGRVIVDDYGITPDQWTAWESLVTCPDCILEKP